MEIEQQLLHRTLDTRQSDNKEEPDMAKNKDGVPTFKDPLKEEVHQNTRDIYFPDGFGNEVMSSKNS